MSVCVSVCLTFRNEQFGSDWKDFQYSELLGFFENLSREFKTAIVHGNYMGHVLTVFLSSDSVNELKGKSNYNKTCNVTCHYSYYHVVPKHLTSVHFK
jgi:hypothetical protein